MARDRSNYQRGGKGGRGGPRVGAPGSTYPNRTDMQTGPRQATQPIRTATGQPYGVAGQQEALQQSQRLPLGPPVVPLSAPTQRPNEPVTAGLMSGPGPGPEAIPGSAPDPQGDLETYLRALYSKFPLEGIGEMLEELIESRQRMAAVTTPMRSKPNTMSSSPDPYSMPPSMAPF